MDSEIGPVLDRYLLFADDLVMLRPNCQSERNIHPLYLSNIDPPITD